jgi:uncharacterized membrane protein
MGENHFTAAPTALYGIVLLMAALAYTLLQNCIVAVEGESSLLGRAVGGDRKGKASLAAYIVAIGCSFFVPMVAHALYVAVALMWLVPDTRIERTISPPSRLL